jgi:site-specific DNA-methyltransferase (adenine-specific)
MKPAVVVGGARVFQGDCIEVLKGLPENSVDSIVTDPPYGLGFMGKEWDTFGGKSGIAENVAAEIQGRYREKAPGTPRYAGTARPARPSDGEMLAFQLWCTEWAVECLRVLKPGGHILAFGGSRTWHRLAVAVEDAGFEIRDNIAWIYGSGFPKSLDVSKAIDKKLGAERNRIKLIGGALNSGTANGWNGSSNHSPTAKLAGTKQDENCVTSEAKTWEGWGTALKPAHEPVVVGRKPLTGTVAENVLAWGVGGLNIDGSRIEHDGTGQWGTINRSNTRGVYGSFGDEDGETPGSKRNPAGRWPANVIFDEVTAGLLDEQSGVSKSADGGGTRKTALGRMNDDGWQPKETEMPGYGDSGGASRFFYVAKASKRDRNEGLEELEAKSAAEMTGRKEGSAGLVMKHVDGSDKANAYAGTTGSARQNFHPTVKPTALMRYLIKLVTPPGGTVLDPFTGSGSTGKAALLDAFQFVGIELTEEYLPIIEGRLKWANEKVDEDDTLF